MLSCMVGIMGRRAVLHACGISGCLLLFGVALGLLFWQVPGIGDALRYIAHSAYGATSSVQPAFQAGVTTMLYISIRNIMVTVILSLGGVAILSCGTKIKSLMPKQKTTRRNSLGNIITKADRKIAYPLAEVYAPSLKHVSDHQKNICIFLYLLPFFILILNGMLIGGLAMQAAMNNQLNLFTAAIVPHGMIEIPLIISAGAVGILIANSAKTAIEQGKRNILCVATIQTKFWVEYILAICALLILAALIEAFITPAVMAGGV